MNNRLILVCFLVFLVPLHVRAQTPPEPVLVDELGLHGCEDFRSRIDNWIVESKRHPEAVPYAIVTGPAANLLARITYREWIKGHLALRFERKELRDRFRVLEGSLSPGHRVELWLADKEDRSLEKRETRWDLSLSMTMPTPYFQSVGDGGICPGVNHVAVFKSLIEANPTLTGRVIFHKKDRAQFSKERVEFLAQDPQIPASRFRFVRPSNSASIYEGHVEYWFIPASGNR